MKKVYCVIAHPKIGDQYIHSMYSNNKEAEEIAKMLEKESLDRYDNDYLCINYNKYEVKECIIEEEEK